MYLFCMVISEGWTARIGLQEMLIQRKSKADFVRCQMTRVINSIIEWRANPRGQPAVSHHLCFDFRASYLICRALSLAYHRSRQPL